MKNQILLDNLIKMNETDRLRAVIKDKETILGDEFITFMRGQIEFAESVEKGAGYFDKVYVGEDSSFLNFMKKEMEIHAVNVDIVWNSIQRVVRYLDEKLLFETGMIGALNNHVEAISERKHACYKCSELVESHGLCNGCLHTGKQPVSAKQKENSGNEENKFPKDPKTEMNQAPTKRYSN